MFSTDPRNTLMESWQGLVRERASRIASEIAASVAGNSQTASELGASESTTGVTGFVFLETETEQQQQQ